MFIFVLAAPQVVAVTGRMLKSVPNQLQALLLRGRAYMYLAEHDMAKRHFGEALKHDPDHAGARREFKKIKDLDKKRQRAARSALLSLSNGLVMLASLSKFAASQLTHCNVMVLYVGSMVVWTACSLLCYLLSLQLLHTQ